MENLFRYFISSDRDPMLAQQLNRLLRDVDDRLEELEFKNSNVGKKPDISRAEKSAILYELGIFDYLLGLKISQKKIAILLGLIFNASPSNIEKDLSLRNSTEAPFKTKDTYNFLVQKFNELGLEDLERKSQDFLNKLEK